MCFITEVLLAMLVTKVNRHCLDVRCSPLTLVFHQELLSMTISGLRRCWCHRRTRAVGMVMMMLLENDGDGLSLHWEEGAV